MFLVVAPRIKRGVFVGMSGNSPQGEFFYGKKNFQFGFGCNR